MKNLSVLLAQLVFVLVLNTGFGQTSITFLHYNDLHAHLETHKDMVRSGDPCGHDNTATTTIGYRGGLARLKTLVDSLRQEYPNNVLMNIGDTYHGGVEAVYTSGNAIVDPVNAIGFDIGVPGNWDFAYGPAVFRKRYTPTGPFPTAFNFLLPSYAIKSPDFTYLAANVTYDKISPADPSPDGDYVLPPTEIITIDNVDIGFIGITSDIVPTMYEQLSTGFNFLQGELEYVNLINTLSADLRNSGCEVVVVMSELGIHKDYQLAQLISVGSVNAFFSAHTHELTYVPLESASGAIVLEAGNDGYLGKLDITVGTSGDVTIDHWELIQVTTDFAKDSTVDGLVNQERQAFLVADPNLADPMGTSAQELHRPITDTVGYSNITLSRINSLESSFNGAFTDILKSYGGTNAAMSPGFRFDSPTGEPGSTQEGNIVATGEITVEDIYRFFPTFYTISTAEVRMDTLEHIFETLFKNVYSTDAFEQGGGWVDGLSGLEMDIDLNQPDFARIQQVSWSGGAPLNGSDTISITGCERPMEDSVTLCSHTGFFHKQALINTTTSQAWTPQQMLEDYLQTDTIDAPEAQVFYDYPANWEYPAYPWVQPLPATVSCAQLNVYDIGSATMDFTLYPNPAGEVVYIQTDEVLEQVEVVDIHGNRVHIEYDAPQKRIGLPGLTPGIYFIKIASVDNRIAVRKMVKL